jgi:hypothetical protein
MSANETMGDSRPSNKPGVYRTPDGHEITTTRDPRFAAIQADAMVQQGYVWVSDFPEETKTKETPKTK